MVLQVPFYYHRFSNIDLYSRLDNQGRRFIPLSSLLPRGRDEFDYSPEYTKMMDQLRRRMIDQIRHAQERIVAELVLSPIVAGDADLIDYILQAKFHNLHRLKYQEDYGNLNVDRRRYGQIMAFCMKMWFDEMEKIWFANWKKLEYIFDPEFMSKRKTGWDEINLVDIKILECYIVTDATEVDPDFYVPPPPGMDDDEDPDTAGVPIAGYIEVALPDDDYSIEVKLTSAGLETIKEIESKIRN